MLKRIMTATLTVAIILSIVSLGARAESTYDKEIVNVYFDGIKVEQEVILDGDTVMVPLSWLTYFGLLDVSEKSNEYEFFYPEQKNEKNFARRIFISKDDSRKFEIGYYYNSVSFFDTITKYYSSLVSSFEKMNELGKVVSEAQTKEDLINGLVNSLGGETDKSASARENYKIIYTGSFSKSIIFENKLYFPAYELLPLINAKVCVSNDGAICIKPNHYSLFRVLYSQDISSNVFDIDEVLPGGMKTFVNVSSYTISALFGKFQRLDFVTHSGEVLDYEDIFKNYLTDDEIYLSVIGDSDERKLAEYIASNTKDLNTVLKTINSLNVKGETSGGEEIRIFEMFADAMYSSYDKEYYFLKDFDGATKVVGKASEIYDYLYTYIAQVEDHRNMLNAVYNYEKYTSGNDYGRLAANTVADMYNKSYTTAAVTTVTNEVYKKVIDKTIGEIPNALSSSLSTALKASSSIMKFIPSTKRALDMMDENVKLNLYHDISKRSYNAFTTRIFSGNLTEDALENARLSLLLTLLSSKNAYGADIFGNDYKERIDSIKETIELLYLASDGTKCEGFDYYEKEKNRLSGIISQMNAIKNPNQQQTKLSENLSASFKEILERGYWIEYSWQTESFVAHSFKDGIVQTPHYEYDAGTVKESNLSYLTKQTYTIEDNTVTIQYDIPSITMTYNKADDCLEYIIGETNALGEQGKHTLFHHNNIPDYSTVINESPYFKSLNQTDTTQTYNNQEYGWSIKLTDGWTCVYEEKDNSYGVYGCTDFGSNDNAGDEGFNIYAVPLVSEKDDKKSGVYSSAPDYGYLGENSQYAFYWSITGVNAQTGYPLTPNLSEKIKSILKSFKIQ